MKGTYIHTCPQNSQSHIPNTLKNICHTHTQTTNTKHYTNISDTSNTHTHTHTMNMHAQLSSSFFLDSYDWANTIRNLNQFLQMKDQNKQKK